MRQVASVVKDGRVQYFIADTDEGTISEFATIVVPETFGGEASIKLGFNLIAAVGLNGHANGKPRKAREVGPAPRAIAVAQSELDLTDEETDDTDDTGPDIAPDALIVWRGWQSAVAHVRDKPGITPTQMHHAVEAQGVTYAGVASACKRAVSKGYAINKGNGRLYPKAPRLGSTVEKARRRTEGRRDWSHVKTEDVEQRIREMPGIGVGPLAELLLGEDTKEHRLVVTNRVMSLVQRAKKGQGPDVRKEYRPNPNGGTDTVHYTLIE